MPKVRITLPQLRELVKGRKVAIHSAIGPLSITHRQLFKQLAEVMEIEDDELLPLNYSFTEGARGIILKKIQLPWFP
jgi:hypothetical protein